MFDQTHGNYYRGGVEIKRGDMICNFCLGCSIGILQGSIMCGELRVGECDAGGRKKVLWT